MNPITKYALIYTVNGMVMGMWLTILIQELAKR